LSHSDQPGSVKHYHRFVLLIVGMSHSLVSNGGSRNSTLLDNVSASLSLF
jgi:hypothetical protein